MDEFALSIRAAFTNRGYTSEEVDSAITAMLAAAEKYLADGKSMEDVENDAGGVMSNIVRDIDAKRTRRQRMDAVKIQLTIGVLTIAALLFIK
jgi:hypothetical protein